MELRETNRLEFKRELTNSFLKTVSAFANYGTGKIVFGVDDDGHKVGLKDLDETRIKIENKINDVLEPIPHYTLEQDDAQKTITLTVYDGPYKPYLSHGKAYKRSDTSTVPVDRLEYGRLVLEGQNLTFDELPTRATQLQWGVLERELQQRLGVERLDSDVMRTLGLLNKSGEFTNAAELLADTNAFPGIDIACFGKSVNEIFMRKTLDGVSVLMQLAQAQELFEQQYCYERIDGQVRTLVERIPSRAFREALANAITHRTWDVSAHITVGMHPDSLAITSPGGLPTGLTESDYLHGSVSLLRNPVLASVLFRLRYIEQFGTGVTRMIGAYDGTQMGPSFEIRDGSIKVVLPAIDTAVAMTPEETRVFSLFDRGTILSSGEIAQELNLTKSKILRILNMLISKGVLEKVGSSRSTRYKVP